MSFRDLPSEDQAEVLRTRDAVARTARSHEDALVGLGGRRRLRKYERLTKRYRKQCGCYRWNPQSSSVR